MEFEKEIAAIRKAPILKSLEDGCKKQYGSVRDKLEMFFQDVSHEGPYYLRGDYEREREVREKVVLSDVQKEIRKLEAFLDEFDKETGGVSA